METFDEVIGFIGFFSLIGFVSGFMMCPPAGFPLLLLFILCVCIYAFVHGLRRIFIWLADIFNSFFR
jgi:hypothetical protein